MGRIKGNNNKNSGFLTFFMSVTFVILSLIIIIGGALIFFSGNFANAGSAKDGKQLIEGNEWGDSVPLMKQVANHLELKFDQKATSSEMKNVLKEITVKDLKDITHIALVNQQLTTLPPALEHFSGLRSINLTGNQLLGIPDFLNNENIEVIAENNILSEDYKYENQYHVYLLEVMKDEYNSITFDTVYDESILKDAAKKSLWIVADLPKGGQTISPLSEEHTFELVFFEDVDGSGGKTGDYVDGDGNILKPGIISGEFYIKNSSSNNKNARFPFEIRLTNDSLVPVEISAWEDNKSIINAVINKFNVEKIEDVTSLMLLTIKELEITDELSSWPKIINDMTNLETLNFTKYQGEKIPDISIIKNINTINLSNLDNQKLLNNLKLPENITKINVSNNKLFKIPKEIIENPNLKEIDASDNNLFTIVDNNKERYILSDNFLSDDFPNQKNIEFIGNFNEINLDVANKNIIDEINEYVYKNITIDNLDKEDFEFALLNSKNEEITKTSQISDEDTLYFGIKDVDVKNTNAFVSVPLKTEVTNNEVSQIILPEDEKNIEEVVDEEKNNEIVEKTLSTITYNAVENVLGKDKPSIIEVDIDDIALIEKDALKAIKDNGKDLKINRTVDDDTQYSWFINTEGIETTKDISLDLHFQSYDTNENKENIVLAFKYSGNSLPDGTNLTISMKNKFDSDEHYLYKQNIDGKVEYVSSVLKVNNEITFPITTADEYFIANTIIKNGLNNPGQTDKFVFTPLNIVLMTLAAAIAFTFIWGSSKIFTKKEFATSMPNDKNYAKEYKQIQKTEKLVKSDTMEFDSITSEMVEKFKQSKPLGDNIEIGYFDVEEKRKAPENFIIKNRDSNNMHYKKKENLTLHESHLNFNEKNHLKNNGQLKFEGLEEHFGENANFQRSDEKTPAEFSENILEGFNLPSKNKKVIGDNDFDEYNLKY